MLCRTRVKDGFCNNFGFFNSNTFSIGRVTQESTNGTVQNTIEYLTKYQPVPTQDPLSYKWGGVNPLMFTCFNSARIFLDNFINLCEDMTDSEHDSSIEDAIKSSSRFYFHKEDFIKAVEALKDFCPSEDKTRKYLIVRTLCSVTVAYESPSGVLYNKNTGELENVKTLFLTERKR